MEESFELMYGQGGHGGPWHGLDDAVEGARRFLRGCKTEDRVYVVPRDTRPLAHRNAARVVTRADL